MATPDTLSEAELLNFLEENGGAEVGALRDIEPAKRGRQIGRR